MTLHDRLLAALQLAGPVRLLASLRDERLGFPDPKDLRVFIPDLHLISKRRAKAFTYVTNREENLVATLEQVCSLKEDLAIDETMVVYQLGDFLDLWRESPSHSLDVASRIKDDHEDLVEVLLRPELKARFLLGNHDFELHQLPEYTAWERRYYLPDGSLHAPSAIVLHGDLFDWIERFPDSVQRVLVYIMAPHLSPNDYALGEMKDLIVRSHGDRNYGTYIQARTPRQVGHLQDVISPVPDRWNVQTEEQQGQTKFLAQAHSACQDANEKYDLNLRVAVIGHTHHARIAVSEIGDQLFTLIDCGAWIERCVDSEGETMPNAQIAAITANEARIYQLGDPAE